MTKNRSFLDPLFLAKIAILDARNRSKKGVQKVVKIGHFGHVLDPFLITFWSLFDHFFSVFRKIAGLGLWSRTSSEGIGTSPPHIYFVAGRLRNRIRDTIPKPPTHKINVGWRSPDTLGARSWSEPKVSGIQNRLKIGSFGVSAKMGHFGEGRLQIILRHMCTFTCRYVFHAYTCLYFFGLLDDMLLLIAPSVWTLFWTLYGPLIYPFS